MAAFFALGAEIHSAVFKTNLSQWNPPVEDVIGFEETIKKHLAELAPLANTKRASLEDALAREELADSTLLVVGNHRRQCVIFFFPFDSSCCTQI